MSKILAYTITHQSRRFLPQVVPAARATAGLWFDWLVVLSDPDATLAEQADRLLHDPKGHGVQHLKSWPGENRGQHWGTKVALELARSGGYEWLLRIDDDIGFKTKNWLRKMLDRLIWLRAAVDDPTHRIVAAPKVIGLNNPLHPIGVIELPGQDFPCEVMDVLGGACRLHPTALLDDFVPDLYAPVGRTDPEQLARHLIGKPGQPSRGMQVRFPDIRVVHRTTQIEEQDTPQMRLVRRMSKGWCWLGEGV